MNGIFLGKMGQICECSCGRTKVTRPCFAPDYAVVHCDECDGVMYPTWHVRNSRGHIKGYVCGASHADALESARQTPKYERLKSFIVTARYPSECPGPPTEDNFLPQNPNNTRNVVISTLVIEYIRTIRNTVKRDYAKAYYAWLIAGKMGQEPQRGKLSYRAAQAVRFNVHATFA